LDVDTTYSLPTGGTTYTPGTAAQLQSDITSASRGDVIVLEAGTTYTATSSAGFSFPDKGAGSDWIYIISDGLASLPAGTRVGASDSSYMPSVQAQAGGGGNRIISFASGADHYRFVGINFNQDNESSNRQTIGLCVDTEAGTCNSVATCPQYIIFDRIILHGNTSAEMRQGIRLFGSNLAVIDSYIYDVVETGADNYAIFLLNSPGPVLIKNNYLSAAGMSVFSGGADAASAAMMPQDVTIQQNHMFKPLAWGAAGYQIKNHLELKMGQRFLIEGNIFENMWVEAQWHSIKLKSENQDGGAETWTVTEHVTFRYNKILNVGNAINISDNVNDPESLATNANHFYFHDNLIVINDSFSYGSASPFLQNYWEVDDLIVDHNTVVGGGGYRMFYMGGNQEETLDLINNIYLFGSEAIRTDGSAGGTASLDASYAAWAATNNAWVGGSASGYPSGNFYPANWAAIGFVDYQADGSGDYRLDTGSTYENAGTDGKDLGADIDALEAALAGEEDTPSTIIKKIMNFFRRLRG